MRVYSIHKVDPTIMFNLTSEKSPLEPCFQYSADFDSNSPYSADCFYGSLQKNDWSKMAAAFLVP